MKLSFIMLIFTGLTIFNHAKAKNRNEPSETGVTLEIVLDDAIKSVPTLFVYNTTFYKVSVQNRDQAIIKPQALKGNTYIFSLPKQKKTAYFSLGYRNKMRDTLILDYYFFEPGDHVKINVSKGRRIGEFELNFSGNGSAKYSCKSDFVAAIRRENKIMEDDSTDNDEKDNYRCKLRFIKVCMALIDKYKPMMSGFASQLLRADIVGKIGSKMLNDVLYKYAAIKEDDDMIGDQKVTEDYFSRYRLLDVSGISDSVLTFSVWYPNYRLTVVKVEKAITKGMKNQIGDLTSINKIENSDLRDKVLTAYIVQEWNMIDRNLDMVLEDVLNTVKDKTCYKKIEEYTRHSAGRKAFDFSLTDVDGKNVRLSDFKGKTVFIDFYFTGCTNCKIYYKGTLKDIENKYADNKAVVFISISIDRDKIKWKKGVKSGEYNSPEGINLYTNGEWLDNELIRYYNINGYPAPMLVDKNGRIINFTGFYLRSGANLIHEIDKALLR